LWVLAACALALGAWAAEKEATPQKSIAVDLGGGVKMDLVLIPAGSFSMGSEKGEATEKPVHEVKIPKPFYMGKYEVTQEQWQAVMGNNPSHFKGPKNPVEFVSWDDCQAFLKKLNERVRRGKFTLPTEAEWEYACRAGSKTDFYFGDDDKQLDGYAWYQDNSEKKTHPVGEKRPNAWGLYDMHGNVWEWCEDAFHDGYEGAPDDGSAWVRVNEEGLVEQLKGRRVIRGGCWEYRPLNCRSADRRYFQAPKAWADGIGLRVVLRHF
jgi:formylglycine-generating enzyme required for sulfatase activity